jgi:hypothetical protein
LLVRFCENSTAPGVDVLNVWGRLCLEVQRLLPVEGNRFRRLFGDDIIAYRTNTDLVGDSLDIGVTQLIVPDPVAQSGLDFISGPRDCLVKKIV